MAIGAGQVDILYGYLPGLLNIENLAAKFAVVHETGLESGLAVSLSEPVNPYTSGVVHLIFWGEGRQ